MKLWGGRFSKGTNILVDEYNASISFDYQLAAHDIEGSLAHVSMLGKCGLISLEESETIRAGLHKIRQKIEQGEVAFRLSDEDIHMNIERLLHEEIGEVAGKLHTGRSRNDQVALDVHLYVRDNIIKIVAQLHDFLATIHALASEHIDTFMPGYTHLQRAEPVRLAHHLLAYFNMFSRDVDRLCSSFSRVNISPLGAGALAGSGVEVDNHYVAKQLKCDGTYANSLDAVSDRDFVIEFLSHAALIMMHFSRLSEELILWSSNEFSFVSFDDAFCTGSSMMPQKKNPDVCELARGKTGRVYGALIGLLTTLKGLPLAYNKDMQEDKEGLFDTVKTLSQTLAVYTPMLASIHINKDKMREATENDFSNATSLANYLTSKNVPFRIAHEITGKIVLYCIENHLLLKDITLEKYKEFSEQFDKDVFNVLTPESVIEAHKVSGGTSKNSVENQLSNCKEVLSRITDWVSTHYV
jgi:argininosuccinate lyase